jgi:hypothetical protein
MIVYSKLLEDRYNAYVLLDEVQATVVWHKGGDLLSVLHQLYTRALTDSRVRLLGFDATAIPERCVCQLFVVLQK